MSSMQIEIVKIIVGIIGVIVSMLILYYAIRNKDIKNEDKKMNMDIKINYDTKNNKEEETVVLDNAADSTVLLGDDKRKDDTVCL